MVLVLQPVLLLALLLSCLVFARRAHVGAASDELRPGQSLSGNQTLVSKDGNFELGFFCPGKNFRKHYVGIWFRRIPKRTVVWVANREAPVADPSTSELRISGNGDLVLLGPSKAPVWTSNGSSTRPSAADSFVAQLLDSGNLVVRLQSDPSSAVVWQSFDHPTDTWLPGGWLGLNKVTGEYQYLRSWRSSEDPAPGPFSYHIDEKGSSQFFLRWNGSVSYWTTGNWTGQFSTMPEVKSSQHFNFSYDDGGQRRGYTYSVQSSFGFTRATLDLFGRIGLLVWFQGAQEWQLVWGRPIEPCASYSVCGAFSICDERSLRLCECLQGFEAADKEQWEQGDWSGGCARRTHLNCSGSGRLGGGQDGFLPVSGLQLPAPVSQVVEGKSVRECEIACLGDCDCTAYAYGTGCSVWNGEIRNAQKVFDTNSQKTLYVRLPTSELSTSASEHVTAAYVVSKPVIIGIVLGGAFLTFATLGLLYRMRRQSYQKKMRFVEGPLISFTYANLMHITNNFSEKLGQGGFGSVFRGTLPDLTEVAVKRLEGAAQGGKQFCAEVRTLGTVHHINLVRLCGFCAQGTRKLLVYEYMPNGSLDAHLFGSSRSKLSWNLRYQIMLGVAGGLAYLHDECRDSIIHCDIKPENILLDAAFQPKIADFGLAKLLGRDFSRVLTSMRGTIGYLAPEWLSGLPITSKADVYSYGMLVFEIISGRRNTEKPDQLSESISFFPLWAASKLCEGEEVLGLLDETLHGVADADQLTRACKVACWCIQESEDNRPSMNQVIQILEGVLEVGTPPVPRTLQHLIGEETCSSSFFFLAASSSSGSPS